MEMLISLYQILLQLDRNEINHKKARKLAGKVFKPFSAFVNHFCKDHGDTIRAICAVATFLTAVVAIVVSHHDAGNSAQIAVLQDQVFELNQEHVADSQRRAFDHQQLIALAQKLVALERAAGRHQHAIAHVLHDRNGKLQPQATP